MATQVALALTLLAGAGVLVRSFWNLAHVDPGISADDVITFQLSVPERRFAADADVWSLYERLLERLRNAPGVRSAAAMSGRLPQRRANNTTFLIEGVPVQGHQGMPQVDFIQHVTPDYFQTLGIRILKGRPFTAADSERVGPVAIVNHTLARKFWPGKDPLGQRLKPVLPDNSWVTVVGVVDDVKHAGLSAAVGTEIYVTHRQARLLLSGWLPSSLHVVVRVDSDRVDALLRSIPALIRDVDPSVAHAGLRTMSDSISASIAGPAFVASLLAAFAALALLLATVGIYGVIACGVAQRTSEFGVRMVLGASPRSVLRLVLVHSALPIAVGVALGLAGTFWANRLLTGLVFQVSPADPATLAIAVGALCAVALVACWIPARRATRVDPIDALRTS
jgi:putative ABC transport system permease protein